MKKVQEFREEFSLPKEIHSDEFLLNALEENNFDFAQTFLAIIK